MSHTAPVTHSIDAEGIGWITFDHPVARVNLFTPDVFIALRAALAALATQPVNAIVLISAKEKTFLAGADLKWLAALADEKAATHVAREGQELFGLIAAGKVPVVCAIHGACAGGGYELALACTWRIATTARETVIGLPEVGLGLIPGWGGCTRLPRLIGPPLAVEHMLQATLISAAEAQRVGLVDELVPAVELKAHAKAVALRLATQGVPPRLVPPAADSDFFVRQRKLVLTRMRGQPAPLAVLDAVEKSAGLPVPTALDLEAALFGEVAPGEIAKNLIRVFFLKEAAKKNTVDAWFSPAAASAPPKPFRTIGIVGAGVMGSGIAHWCALHGYGVILCDSNHEAINRGVAVIRELFADAVARGKLTHDEAHKLIGGIGITVSLEDFEICDLVIEAVVEDLGTKQALFEKLSGLVDPGCVLASNTSALPIEQLAAAVTNPGRVVGLHFFNPVGRMPLVELVLSPHTTRTTAERALAFVKALGKAAVICRSSPGFLVTRVLFFYLNEACRLWEEGVPTEVLDGAMRDWGWPMGPMRLIDEVGVDVTGLIFGEMKHYFPARFSETTVCQRLLGGGMKGRKNGTGFYQYANERAGLNPALAGFARGPAVALPARSIQARLNGVLLDETKRVLAEGVLKTADDADLALLMGAGFPAFRGGLLYSARSNNGLPSRSAKAKPLPV